MFHVKHKKVLLTTARLFANYRPEFFIMPTFCIFCLALVAGASADGLTVDFAYTTHGLTADFADATADFALHLAECADGLTAVFLRVRHG